MQLPPKNFKSLALHFVEEIQYLLRQSAVRKGALHAIFCSASFISEVIAMLDLDYTVTTLKESLAAKLSPTEDPRLSSFRCAWAYSLGLEN
jgi:hypothetical protein